MEISNPLMKRVAVSQLRPTQMTVGFRVVNAKREKWKALDEHARAEFLGRQMIPVVTGPKSRAYIVDHHHLARALQEEGVDDVLTIAVADFSHLKDEAFWIALDNQSLCHTYDSNGVRQGFSEMPKRLAKLKDDPFRSIASDVRKEGGYAKAPIPFLEFLWADFLRRLLTKKDVAKDYPGALAIAMKAARSKKANYLPGWCGASDHGLGSE